MALVVSTLQADLQATFLAMNDITDGSGDRYMADNVAKNIKDYILTGKTSTTDAGAAPAGTYSGSGSGTMTIDDSICIRLLQPDMITTVLLLTWRRI